MKITLCVPVPPGGQALFTLLIESAARLASGAHDIDVDFTCHDEAQRQALLAEPLPLPIGQAHVVEREGRVYLHANSVTHSRCVNALYGAADADVAVICDFDMAFALPDWDALLVDRVVKDDIAFLGTPYSSDAGFAFKLPQGVVFARKYQGKPNCMFIAFAPRKLKALSERLCEFAAIHGDPASLPLRLIATIADSRNFGLPIGSFMQVDTGSLIPTLIEWHKLKHRSLERRVKLYQVLKSVRVPDNYHAALLPEEYLGDGRPLIVHLRKGASKPTHEIYNQDLFVQDVRKWIDAIAPQTSFAGAAE